MVRISDRLRSIFTPQVRGYLYALLLALNPIAVAVGLYSESMAPLIIAAAASLLGFGMARANTPVHEGH